MLLLTRQQGAGNVQGCQGCANIPAPTLLTLPKMGVVVAQASGCSGVRVRISDGPGFYLLEWEVDSAKVDGVKEGEGQPQEGPSPHAMPTVLTPSSAAGAKWLCNSTWH